MEFETTVTRTRHTITVNINADLLAFIKAA
jgi:hypothetical protein